MTLFSDAEMPRLWTPDDWCSPLEVVECVDAFNDGEPVDLDPTSNELSIVRARVAWRREDDSRARPWWWTGGGPAHSVYCNPPYSDPTPFVRTCAEPARFGFKGCWALGLLKLDPSVKWWNDFVRPYACGYCFVDHRLEFRKEDGSIAGNNFPSVVVLWSSHPRHSKFKHAFSPLGEVVTR